MSNFLRKHRKPILIGAAALIIPSFILWGGKTSSNKKAAKELQASQIVAQVGNTPIAVPELHQALNQEMQRRSQYGGPKPSLQQMLMDGTVERVLMGLVDRELLAQEAAKLGYTFDRELLVEKLKDYQDFKDENGNFDAEGWNAFVDGDRDWNGIYEMVSRQLRQGMLVQEITASARVSERDIREQFEKDRTKVKVKYVALKPPVEPTEEEIKAHYDEDPSVYDNPEQRRAQFVAVSLEPPRPALLDEVLQKARAGEDFAELAKAHSQGPNEDEGGDLGWMTEALTTPAHQKPLFALKAGDVSDVVEGPLGFYIYKVEEERESAVAGQRDVKARQIVLRGILDPDVRAQREAKAEEIAAAVKESGDLASIGLGVQTTGLFTPTTTEIENIPAEDAGSFRIALSKVAADGVSDVVKGRKNLYVARVVEVVAPTPRPLEEVRDDVKEDTIRAIERSEDYRTKVASIADEISEKAEAIGQIPAMFPDIKAEVKEIPPFSSRDYDWQSGPPWNPQAVLQELADVEPGALVGPVQDFMGDQYFVELMERITPDAETLDEDWDKEKEMLMQQAEQRAQMARLDDYLLDLRQRGQWTMNQDVLMRALGLGGPEEDVEEAGGEDPAEGDVTDAADTPADPAADAPAPADPADGAEAPAEAPADDAQE
ncbi:MAG: hypothetical protein GY851_26510 [bacterium]|nr:hypothetical protein [bacterium]